MSVWAIVYLCLVAMSFGVVAVKHGQPKGPYSLWGWFISVSITIPILYMGGFFKVQ